MGCLGGYFSCLSVVLVNLVTELKLTTFDVLELVMHEILQDTNHVRAYVRGIFLLVRERCEYNESLL